MNTTAKVPHYILRRAIGFSGDPNKPMYFAGWDGQIAKWIVDRDLALSLSILEAQQNLTRIGWHKASLVETQ
jgi:hypothetical protein